MFYSERRTMYFALVFERTAYTMEILTYIYISPMLILIRCCCYEGLKIFSSKIYHLDFMGKLVDFELGNVISRGESLEKIHGPKVLNISELKTIE